MNKLELKSRIEGQFEEHIEILEDMTRDPMLRASQRIAAIKQLQAIFLLLENNTSQEKSDDFTEDEGGLPLRLTIG
ncbi:hypothetical protein WKH16_22485 [Pantoea agglomerans]|uniref:hypothetical protein n=1 Tax=Enterobacter agglomerans TaxID=549 RepID=UPI003C7EC0EC